MSFWDFLVAILPIFLIGTYIYQKDKVKESSKLLFKLFMCGVISCFPAAILGTLLGFLFPAIEDMNFFQVLLYVFIVVSLIEELCKWFFLYKLSYNHSEFDSLYDMIVYASFVALGFACFENLLYVSSSGIIVGLFRAITAVPGHVCDGIIMGSYLALAKNCYLNGDDKLSKRYKILSILIPILVHGIYDLCLFWNASMFIVLFIFFVISLFLICFKKVKEISENNIKFGYQNQYCIKCGNLINGNFCSNCGQKKQDLT